MRVLLDSNVWLAVLSRRGFTGPEQLEQVYFVFTVAKDGKITRIE